MRKLFFAILASLLFVAGGAKAEYQLPSQEDIVANAEALQSLEKFYDDMEAALKAEDIDKIMSFYAKDYLHLGITRTQLRFMWLEIFNTYNDLYSIHAFSRIDVNRADAILNCTGALMGIEKQGHDYQAIDRWIMQNHWITRIGKEWKIVGGASHQGATIKESAQESHPLF